MALNTYSHEMRALLCLLADGDERNLFALVIAIGALSPGIEHGFAIDPEPVMMLPLG